MDAVLSRLQSIRQCIEHVTLLPADQEQKIQIMLLDICRKLQTSEAYGEDLTKSSCDEVHFMLNKIESLLYIPVIKHLISNVQSRGEENNNYDNHLTVQPVHSAQETGVGQKKKIEKNRRKSKRIEIHQEDESISGTSYDYWKTRKDRMHSLLGETSLRFDKKYLKRNEQKSLLQDPCIAETSDTEVSCKDLRTSHSHRESEKRSQYSENDIDKFWGLTEDKRLASEQKKWKNGETICVLNSKSELRKLTEIFKQKKEVRSYYIQRKPKGLAGLKGTWITPPYSPPLVVKYGIPLV